jgi:hypothetical protein
MSFDRLRMAIVYQIVFVVSGGLLPFGRLRAV